MSEVKLKYIGEDSFNRPVYKDEEGNLFKDINLGQGEVSLCTVYGGFDGEPDTPIEYIERYKNVRFRLDK